MKRYRVTLMVICLVLLYLGGDTIRFHVKNPDPLPISVAELERSGPPREWLTIEGGYVNLLESISTTGSVEVDVFLVPLKISPQAESYRVLFETRDPAIVDALRTYHFKLDSELERQRYLQEHQDLFFGRRDISGQLQDYLPAKRNRGLIESMKRKGEEGLPDDVILFSENKESPMLLGGIFMVVVALLGMVKAAVFWRKPDAPVGE